MTKKQLSNEISGLLKLHERLYDNFFEFKNNCLQFHDNLVVAIERLGQGFSVEGAANCEVESRCTADYLQVMAKIKKAIDVVSKPE